MCKYPKELNPFGASTNSDEEGSVGEETSKGVLEKEADMQEKHSADDMLSQDSAPSSSGRRKRRKKGRKKKAKCPTYPQKETYDEQRSLSSGSASQPSDKETPAQDLEVSGSRCTSKDQSDGGEDSINNSDTMIAVYDCGDDERGAVPVKTPLVQGEQVLKKANPYAAGKHNDQEDQVESDLSTKGKEGEADDGPCSTPELEPSASEYVPSDKARCIPGEASSSDKETRVEQDPETSTSISKVASVHHLVAKELQVSTPILEEDSEKEHIQEKQSENETALSAYVEDEMKLVQDETTSLERVSFKLELEMQDAMKTKELIFRFRFPCSILKTKE
ncbi:hypothetical protein OS493_000287 [Desmophyllum pertusum]|uniref:Uncharacterized protein n=1 Tax=Desmophyllum pertusum TaxID=174260 RepID=A0A9X0A6Q7_9CNID|nr:hypothetical protein OS493_000287 [Desmophyllum pertusum]